MKEKNILGKLIEEEDNLFVLQKFNLHDELKTKMIDKNLEKIQKQDKELVDIFLRNNGYNNVSINTFCKLYYIIFLENHSK